MLDITDELPTLAAAERAHVGDEPDGAAILVGFGALERTVFGENAMTIAVRRVAIVGRIHWVNVHAKHVVHLLGRWTSTAGAAA